jgi:hypothetical protein
MRFPYALAVAGGLVLPAAILAQAVPAPTPAPAQAQAPAGQAQPAQTNLYPTPLYRMNDVSKSLNLTQDQINSLNKLTDQTQVQYRDNYSKINTLNGAERAARAQELNQKYYGDWNKGAQNILNENQRLRYQQLNYQYGGFYALTDPDVQKRLNLTPTQVKGLRENGDWSNEQLQAIKSVEATNPSRAAQMYSDYWKQRQARFEKYLAPEQLKVWNEMTGEPYAFQPNFTPSR